MNDSVLWKTLVKHQVDLYIGGEVHAVTCAQADAIQQVVHGGLIGHTTKPNYMVVTVRKDKPELELKEIDLTNGSERLWQKNKSRRPWDTIMITDERKQKGFTLIGSVTISKQSGKRTFEDATGFFNRPVAQGEKR